MEEHDILSVKLCEMERQMSGLNARIRAGETAGPECLRREIEELRHHCEEDERALRERLHGSRAKMVFAISEDYGEIEESIRKLREKFEKYPGRTEPGHDSAERRILEAEYALDFAALAANRALLCALEAMEAERLENQEGMSQE